MTPGAIHRRWPGLLVLAGLLLLVPHPWPRRASRLLGAGLLSAQRFVDLPDLLRPARALESAGAVGLDQQVRAALEQAAADVRPRQGWVGDGTFHAVPIGENRSHDRLPLALAAGVPEGQPAFLGDTLVGFTVQDEAGAAVIPVTHEGYTLPARAGAAPEKGVVLVARGEGEARMQVVTPASRFSIRDGDPVWTELRLSEQPPLSVWPQLGRIAGDPSDAESARPRQWIDPPWRLADLQQLAVRYPPGQPAPAELQVLPLPVRRLGPALPGRGRAGFRIAAGRERSIVEGAAVSDGQQLLGRVLRAGWHRSLVRSVADPGFRCHVLLLLADGVHPFHLKIRGRDGSRLRLEQAPPATAVDALVITAVSSEWVPAGLQVGRLRRDEHGFFLERKERPEPRDLVHLPVRSP